MLGYLAYASAEPTLSGPPRVAAQLVAPSTGTGAGPTAGLADSAAPGTGRPARRLLPSSQRIVQGEPTAARSADLDRNGRVDAADRDRLLARWGTADSAADIDRSGLVDGADLGLLLATWSASTDTNAGARP